MNKTIRNAKDLTGICMRCKEWTTVHEACCGSFVHVEGSDINPSDYCETCGDELNSDAECDRCEAPARAAKQETTTMAPINHLPSIDSTDDYHQALQAIEVNARIADLLRSELVNITDPQKKAEVQRWVTFHSDRAAIIQKLVDAVKVP